jgi:hypothetical protein
MNEIKELVMSHIIDLCQDNGKNISSEDVLVAGAAITGLVDNLVDRVGSCDTEIDISRCCKALGMEAIETWSKSI